jgi:hypothetical protein
MSAHDGGKDMKLSSATIPDEIVKRVVERRGSEHPFSDLDPAKTALAVIDMQHAFMDEAVGHATRSCSRAGSGGKRIRTAGPTCDRDAD